MKVCRLMAGDNDAELPACSFTLSKEDLEFIIESLEDLTAACRDSHEIARGELMVRLFKRALLV